MRQHDAMKGRAPSAWAAIDGAATRDVVITGHLNPTPPAEPPRIPTLPSGFVERVVRRSSVRQLSKLILSVREPGAGEWHATLADAARAELSRRREKAVRR